MMIPAPLHDLMGAVYLFDEDEEGKGVGHDEVRDTKRLVWYICEELQVDTITSPNDEYDIFSVILARFQHLHEYRCTHATSSLIEEDDSSLRFFESFFYEESFFYFYIFRIGMRDGFYGLQVEIFLCSFAVFGYGFSEVLESVCNCEYCNHEEEYGLSSKTKKLHIQLHNTKKS